MSIGYSLDALVKERWSRYAEPLANNTNINNLDTVDKAGIYMVAANNTAATITGLPIALAGVLEVMPWTPSGQNIQRYTLYNNQGEYTRANTGSGWTGWRKTITDVDVFGVIYPIGIVVQFNKAVNPNNTFPGTTWTQITDGRAIRAATSNVAGTGVGQIGSVGGSDSSTLAVGHLPAHNHGMGHTHNIAAHSHPMPHTHGINSHTHGMNHDHTMNHDHAAVTSSSSGAHTHTTSGTAASNGAHTHSVSGTAASAGAHTHGYITGAQSTGTSGDWDNDGRRNTVQTSSAGAHTHSVSGSAASGGAHTHTTSGTAASAGAHTHTVDLPTFSGNTGWSKEINSTAGKAATDGTALTTNGTNTANTSGTALVTGDPSTPTTGNTGSGSAFSVLNASHYYSFWERTA